MGWDEFDGNIFLLSELFERSDILIINFPTVDGKNRRKIILRLFFLFFTVIVVGGVLFKSII